MNEKSHPGLVSVRKRVWRMTLLATGAVAIVSAQITGGAGCGFGTASAATGADVPATYFGPTPSTVQKELVGPLQLLTAGKLDQQAATITLPLYKGKVRQGNQTVWYILTDTTDRENAAALGLNFSAKLFYAAVSSRAVRTATLQKDNTLMFDAGTVDFSPDLVITPGPASQPFPPTVAKPGSVGDANYSPLVRITNAGGHIYNAPIIAMGDNVQDFADAAGKPNRKYVHDKVVSINISSHERLRIHRNAGPDDRV